VDSEVVMLSAHWEKKRSSLIELQEQLQQIPGFLGDLESMTANLVEHTDKAVIESLDENKSLPHSRDRDSSNYLISAAVPFEEFDHPGSSIEITN
ncbi:Dysbindin, partial [Chelonia mydas]